MHPFHEYQKKQLAEKLKRRVLVWYDPRNEFQPFISELIERDVTQLPPGELATFQLDGNSVHFIAYAGSYFEIRFAVDQLTSGPQPEPLVIYMQGESRQKTSSVLMEFEEGGECYYELSLKRQARNALKEKGFDDGHIDELLNVEALTYEDVVKFVGQSGTTSVQPSMLQVIFGVSQNDKIVASWLASSGKDAEISEKSASQGLYKLIETRLGITTAPELPIHEARKKICRSLLVGEFSNDLQCTVPPTLAMIDVPQEQDKVAFLKLVIQTLRKDHPEEYIAMADSVQAELNLDTAAIPAECLGSIDTFRFEEQALLRYCDSLIINGNYAETLRVETERGSSFWVDRQMDRKAQWRACKMMADLGISIQKVISEMNSASSKPEKWVSAYSSKQGWFCMDQQHRQLEALVAKLEDEPVLHQALSAIEQAYDNALQVMSSGFTKVLQEAQWQIPGTVRQSDIYEKFVAPSNVPVAYFLVDAMRYEMGDELVKQLEGMGEVTLRPAIVSLPSITKVGMAALLPEASSSLDVIVDKDKLSIRIAGSLLGDLPARRKFIKARQQQLVELELDELLQMNSKKLQGKLAGSPMIVVRSQEIDSLGEGTSDFLARQVMDTVIGNVARAVRKLASCGIEQIVLAADHGHLFSREKGDDMKTDSPGGKTIELHRRCWIGQGGSSPQGTVKVSGNELGYDSPLDFIFPSGSGVFKAGGSLSYHHGGTSLQEMVIPLITVRVPPSGVKSSAQRSIVVSGVPELLATRTMGITIEIATTNLLDMIDTGPMTVRPVLVCGGKQVGKAGLAVHGEFDSSTGCVAIKPNEKVMVGMLLSEESETVQVVVLDPQTDAVLGQSGVIEVKLGM
ncbi:PglZ domain-containing protein [Geomonas propionica]|uniref:PglZ domain-containing protein n=1 Tax=Geomonas propionica TaxID=2798582 RepID=A0ABS0YP96_9BACT|nr:PglZ domain-containing protein [Geomonas propionica]MBJ6799738.1 PglZ domain-containing protein [Geomonas propionica]